MKKNKMLIMRWWFLLVLLAVSLIIPLIINETYKLGKGYVTMWNAADVLSFYGSYISFWGTIILGFVAIYQNKKAQELNEQMQKLEQVQFISIISISKFEISKRSATTPTYLNSNMEINEILNLTLESFPSCNCYHIDVEFNNSSSFPIVQLCVQVIHQKNTNSTAQMLSGISGITPIVDHPVYIPEHGKQAIRFIVPTGMLEKTTDHHLSLNIDFINIFDYRTTATIHIDDLEKSFSKYIYRLAKFTDIRI